MLRDSVTDVRAQSTATDENVLLDVAPNKCGCGVVIMNGSMKCVGAEYSRTNRGLASGHSSWTILLSSRGVKLGGGR